MLFRSRFSGLVRGIAERRLSDLASTPSGRAAIQRVALAFISAAKNAKKPDALYNCDSESIGSCMIQSAETGLFPGGPAPAVWLVPKAGQLHWWLSHRGVLTLAERAGYVVSAKPWFQADQFSYEAGTEERISHVPDLAAERTWDTLRGVYVIVRGKIGRAHV